MGLDSLSNINDQEHEVNNLSPSNYSLYQRSMPWTVYQSKLKELLLNYLFELNRHSCKEGRKAKIKGNASFLRLRIFIEASRGCDLAEYFAEGCFT